MRSSRTRQHSSFRPDPPGRHYAPALALTVRRAERTCARRHGRTSRASACRLSGFFEVKLLIAVLFL
eukprot:12909292-Alexandrium_andersonii.AAC.1